jgi:enoyl-CoA hydratase
MSAASHDDLLIDVVGATGTITLNRPEARNALSVELWRRLAETVARLDGEASVSVIVLTGADPAFCAGFDLRRLASEDRPKQVRRQSEPPSFLGMLPPHDVPTIAAVNGPAVTGGLELALGCDVLIASERARFADTHARVGVMPGGGLTIRLPALVGPSRALQMSLTGDFIDARTALEWGLVNEVVPHGRLLERCHELAGAMTSIPRENLVEIRRMHLEMTTLSGDTAWRRENAWARQWMEHRFDQQRLASERQAIVERGRGQQ